MTPTIECEGCAGKGRRPLLGAERITYDVVPSTWTTTEQIASRLLRVKRTALCNRLAKLVRLGVIEGRIAEHNAKVREFRRKPLAKESTRDG